MKLNVYTNLYCKWKVISFLIYSQLFHPNSLQMSPNPSKWVQIFHSDFFMFLHTNWYFIWLYQWHGMFIQFFKWKLLSLNTLSDSLNSKSRLSFPLCIQLSHPNPSKNVQGTCELKFPKSKGLVLCTFSQRG